MKPALLLIVASFHAMGFADPVDDAFKAQSAPANVETRVDDAVRSKATEARQQVHQRTVEVETRRVEEARQATASRAQDEPPKASSAKPGVASIKEWGRMDTVIGKPTGYDVKCSSGYAKTIWRRPGEAWYYKGFPNGYFVADGSLSLEGAAKQLCR